MFNTITDMQSQALELIERSQRLAEELRKASQGTQIKDNTKARTLSILSK